MNSVTLQLNWADYAIIGIMVLSALISLVRGFAREAISLLTWLVALWVAFRFTAPLSQLFVSHVESASVRLIIAFLILFICTLVLGALVNFLFSQLVDRTGLSGTDRMLGVVFGAARGVLMVAVLLLLINMTTFQQDSWYSKSVFIPHFQPLVTWLHDFVPEQKKHLLAMMSPAQDNNAKSNVDANAKDAQPILNIQR